MTNIFITRSAAICAAAGALLLPIAISGPAAAAQASTGVTSSNAVILYSGQPLSSAPLQVTPWGGGLTSDHDGDAYTTAGHTIKIETAGLYQGGKITFSTPVSLGDTKSDKSRFLQLIFSAAYSARYPKQAPTPSYNGNPYGRPGGPFGGRGPMGPGMPGGMGGPYPGGGMPAFPGGPGYNGTEHRLGSYHYQFGQGWVQMAQVPGGYGPNLPPGMNPGMGGPFTGGRNPFMPGGRGGYRPGVGYPGQQNVVPDETVGLPDVPIKDLHIIFVFVGGTEVEMLRPVTVSIGDDITWLHAGIPLSSIPLPAAQTANAQLASMYISSDTPADLNIGEIRLIDDATPITADAGKAQTVPAGTELTLVGTGEGGASALKYEWDFDNGPTFVPEATGVKTTHTFDKSGDQTVTLRVSDVDGIKAPATSTVTIHVEAE